MPSPKLDSQAILVPADTTANRPTASAGMIRYNTSKGYYECYDSIATWRPIYGILYKHHFEDATRNITLSTGSSDTVAITFDFTKKYADSYIFLRGMLPVSGQYSYQSGEYVSIAGIRKYEACNYVSPPDSQGDDGQYGSMSICGVWTGLSTTGTKTVSIGWAPVSGGTGERPGTYWNPDGRGGRARARTTIIDIYEVDPSIMNIIT